MNLNIEYRKKLKRKKNIRNIKHELHGYYKCLFEAYHLKSNDGRGENKIDWDRCRENSQPIMTVLLLPPSESCKTI